MLLALDAPAPTARSPFGIDAPRRAHTWRLYAVWILLIISLVSWRTRVFYTGGVDPTVAAKAALTLIAMALASIRRPIIARIDFGPRTLVITAVYLVSSALGGWASGSAATSSVLAIRSFMVLVTVALVLRSFGEDEAVRTAMFSMCAVGLLIAVAGLPTFAASGRLSGGIFPISPNQLAMLFGPPIIWFLWRMFRGDAPARYGLVVAILLGLCWMTGSRTGIVALLFAAVLTMGTSPRIPRASLFAAVLAFPIAFYILDFTSIVSTFVGRDGTGNVTTLNSRTIAWTAVLNAHPDFSHLWFGGGLSTKTVQVTGQFWDSQVVDSSWVSAYIQAGLVGFILLALWSVTSLIAAFRSPRDRRPLWVGLVVFAVIRSGLESGLIDSAVLFLIMLLPNLALDIRVDPADQNVS